MKLREKLLQNWKNCFSLKSKNIVGRLLYILCEVVKHILFSKQ